MHLRALLITNQHAYATKSVTLRLIQTTVVANAFRDSLNREMLAPALITSELTGLAFLLVGLTSRRIPTKFAPALLDTSNLRALALTRADAWDTPKWMDHVSIPATTMKWRIRSSSATAALSSLRTEIFVKQLPAAPTLSWMGLAFLFAGQMKSLIPQASANAFRGSLFLTLPASARNSLSLTDPVL